METSEKNLSLTFYIEVNFIEIQLLFYKLVNPREIIYFFLNVFESLSALEEEGISLAHVNFESIVFSKKHNRYILTEHLWPPYLEKTHDVDCTLLSPEKFHSMLGVQNIHIDPFKEEIFNMGMLIFNVILMMGHRNKNLFLIYDQIN